MPDVGNAVVLCTIMFHSILYAVKQQFVYCCTASTVSEHSCNNSTGCKVLAVHHTGAAAAATTAVRTTEGIVY
jgi:hypothetical protein